MCDIDGLFRARAGVPELFSVACRRIADRQVLPSFFVSTTLKLELRGQL
jgi:hypothetical protein